MLRKCFDWPETGSLWVRASWWVCVVKWVIFAIVPPAIPPGEARLGPWQLYCCMLALQLLLVCVHPDVSAWHVGTGRMTKRPGCVCYVAADWTFLLYSTVSRFHASCPSSFGGSTNASMMLLPFPSVGILFPDRFKTEKGYFDLSEVPEVVCSVCWCSEIKSSVYRAVEDELWCSGCKEAHCSPSCKPCSSSQGFLPSSVAGREGRIWPLLCIADRENCEFKAAPYSNPLICHTQTNTNLLSYLIHLSEENRALMGQKKMTAKKH